MTEEEWLATVSRTEHTITLTSGRTITYSEYSVAMAAARMSAEKFAHKDADPERFFSATDRSEEDELEMRAEE